MGNYHDFDDEFARADAREKELERQMNMKDGVSSPSNYNAGGYGYAPPPQNNYYGGYNQGGYYNGANQGGYGSMQNPNYPPFYNSAHPQQGVYNRGNMYAVNTLPPSAKSATKAFTICAVVFMFVGILLLGIMIAVVTSLNRKYERCTASADGTVIDNILETHTDDDGTSRSYYPVFRYEYNGRTYEQKSSNGRYPAKYQIGDTVTVHLNPNKPTEFYVDKVDGIIKLVFSILSGVFILFGVLFMTVTIKTKKRQQMAMQ